jgi:hypothetical protein
MNKNDLEQDYREVIDRGCFIPQELLGEILEHLLRTFGEAIQHAYHKQISRFAPFTKDDLLGLKDKYIPAVITLLQEKRFKQLFHGDVEKEFRAVLGRGVYAPATLLPRIRRRLIEVYGTEANELPLNDLNDLFKIKRRYRKAVIIFLARDEYLKTPNTNRAAAITRKAG